MLGLRGLRPKQLIRSLPDALRYQVVILVVDNDGQASADLQAIHGEIAPKQDAQVAAKDDVVRINGPQIADDHGVRHGRPSNRMVTDRRLPISRTVVSTPSRHNFPLPRNSSRPATRPDEEATQFGISQEYSAQDMGPSAPDQEIRDQPDLCRRDATPGPSPRLSRAWPSSDPTPPGS
jgi:hypothetical protein